MRWPFGPPHMTLKPSKKTQKKQNKTKKQKKKKKEKKKQENTKNTQKWAFQLSVRIFFFFGWVSKISLFWQLDRKSAHPKNTIKIGVSGPFFLKSRCASRNGHFWTKKSQIHKFQLSFFLPVFFSFNNTKHKILLKPLFLKCFSKPKKREFSKFKLKTLKIGKPNFCTLFLKKAIFRKLPENWGQKKKHKMITECAKQISWNHYFYRLKTQTWTR